MDDKLLQELIVKLQTLSAYAQDHQVLNYWVWVILVLVSLLLVAATTLAGFQEKGKLAGILSIINGFIIAFQSAFAFGDAAQFYRALHSQTEVVLLDSRDVKTAEDFAKLKSNYRLLVEKLGKEVPIGSGLAAAQSIKGVGGK